MYIIKYKFLKSYVIKFVSNDSQVNILQKPCFDDMVIDTCYKNLHNTQYKDHGIMQSCIPYSLQVARKKLIYL